MGHKEKSTSESTRPHSATAAPGAMDKSLLSTKKLGPADRAMLENAGIAVYDYDAIRIEFLPVRIPGNQDPLIFTSKNGVKACMRSLKTDSRLKDFKIRGCYCVGPKTNALLENKGWKVLRMENTAGDLGRYLIEHSGDKSFLYVCGNRRREELPGILKTHGVSLTELVAYETRISAKKFDTAYNAVLFFSPTGVQSYFTHNALNKAVAYCIGPTTAGEVKKHTDRYKIARLPEISQVVKLALDDLIRAEEGENNDPSKK